jgi:anti-sigma regulatory factor (Ser/Thr protein kinase)
MAETFCRRMLAGETSHAVPDTRNEPALEGLGVTEVAAAYVGVPVQLSDGRVYGTLCCANREPKQALGDRDVSFMRVLARIVADQVEREHGAEVVNPEPARPPGMAARLDLWFAAAPHATASARQALQSLNEHVDDDSLKSLQLLVTELVGNSIRHASIGAESSVGLEVGVFPDHVRAVVSDPGPGFEVTEPAPREDLAGGWGLVLVERMSRDWGVERSGGTRVWFELPLARAEPARS